MLDGVFRVLRSGSAWRDVPGRYGPWRTCYGRFVRWRRDGTFGKILSRLHALLEAEGLTGWSLFRVDGTSVRAAKPAAGARRKKGPTGRSRRTTHRAAAAGAGAPRSTWRPTRGRSRWRRW